MQQINKHDPQFVGEFRAYSSTYSQIKFNGSWSEGRLSQTLFFDYYEEVYMKASMQGAHDGLCGIYSIVNASKLLFKLSNDDADDLFRKIVEYLKEEKAFADIFLKGTSLIRLGSIFKHIEDDNLQIDRSMPFKKKPDASLDEFWNSMKNFLIESERAIILGLDGVHDHWTVVQGITDKQIQLLDSADLKFINRSNCTTREPKKNRPHKILPTHAYFLKRAEY